MSICNYIIFILFILFILEIIYLIKFEIRHYKRMKILKSKWIEICSKAKKQEKKYFEMMKNDNGLKTAFSNAIETIARKNRATD